MKLLKTKREIERYLKVGQKLTLESISMVTRSSHTAKIIKKTVKEIEDETERIMATSMIKFKGDSKRYGVFLSKDNTIHFRWGGKREYWYSLEGNIFESLIEKYLRR